MKRNSYPHKRWHVVVALCSIATFMGCQSALHNTYPVPGERAGQGLKYYRNAFPRGQNPDPWETQNPKTTASEQGNDAQETATTEESTSP